MQKLPKDAIYEYNNDTLEAVRKSLGLEKPGVMENIVNMLEQWVKEQNHFTKKDFERRYLETTIIASKGSIERAKSKLDRTCTIRTLMPHFFGTHHLKYIYKTDLKDIKQAILPKMTKNNERIFILRNVGQKFVDTFIQTYNHQMNYLCEYYKRNDYAENNFIVMDCMEVNLMELLKVIQIGHLQETTAFLFDCCAIRLKALYIISSSKFVGTVVSIFKQALSAKLGERVHVLKERQLLKDIFDESILPKEYGGKEKSLEELHVDLRYLDMDYLPKDALFKYNHDTLQGIRRTYGLDNTNAMKDAIDILEEWVKQQKHFTKTDFDRRYLETTIIANKGSIERSKSRLDKSCTVRTLMSHIFDTHDLRLLYKTDLKDVTMALLPSMTINHERVFLLRNYGKKFEPTLVPSFTQAILSYAEYTRLNDYASSYYLILDYTEVNLVELAKLYTISSLQELASLLLDCCGFRLKALYFITSSKLIEIVIAICKQVVSAKLGSRLHVLKDKEELKRIIDIDILPEEYGGKERPLSELHEDWLNILTTKEHLEYMRQMNSARTDESLRQPDIFNEQYMGIPGTFKAINVD